MKNLTSSALLLCGLFFATSCEKSTIAPELANSSAADAALVKDRAIEARVTGIYYDATTGKNSPFTATLRINSFVTDANQLFAQSTLGQIGGGLSRADVALLEGQQSITFNGVETTAWSPVSLSLNVYGIGYIVGSSSYLVLDSKYNILIDSDIRNYNQALPILGTINTYFSNPTGLANLVNLYNQLANVVGRY